MGRSLAFLRPRLALFLVHSAGPVLLRNPAHRLTCVQSPRGESLTLVQYCIHIHPDAVGCAHEQSAEQVSWRELSLNRPGREFQTQQTWKRKTGQVSEEMWVLGYWAMQG